MWRRAAPDQLSRRCFAAWWRPSTSLSRGPSDGLNSAFAAGAAVAPARGGEVALTLTDAGRAWTPHLPKDPEAIGGRHERPLLIVEPDLLLEDQADALVQRHGEEVLK